MTGEVHGWVVSLELIGSSEGVSARRQKSHTRALVLSVPVQDSRWAMRSKKSEPTSWKGPENHG